MGRKEVVVALVAVLELLQLLVQHSKAVLVDKVLVHSPTGLAVVAVVAVGMAVVAAVAVMTLDLEPALRLVAVVVLDMSTQQ